MPNRSDLPIVLENLPLDPELHMKSSTFVQDIKMLSQLHYHNYLEIGRCIEGSGVQFIEGSTFPFSTHSVSVIAKNSIHESCIVSQHPNEKPSVWRYLFIDMAQLHLDKEEIETSFLTNDERVLSLFDLIWEIYSTDRKSANVEIILLIRVLMLELKRVSKQTVSISQGPYRDTIIYALHIIASNYAGDLTVQQLARECNMSVSYFRKVFNSALGVSPQQYIIQIRLNTAEQLLKTTRLPIQTIADDVGFQTLSSFNRLFRKKFGHAPRSLR